MRFEEIENVVARADQYADDAHEGQVRNYTGEPYISHPRAVAAIVKANGGDDNMVAAALMHDVIEDCGKTREEIAELFGEDIANLVVELSDAATMEMGNRVVRKEFEMNRLGAISNRGKTIKLADLIHNASSIQRHGGKFADIYMEEKSKIGRAHV